ncbi:MAG: LacI family transcriptional regulator [Defluviitaleaceae bacterium]|nr:LacI family transcriptional regulator [Defluviitaleaceae bacterium]MCL2835923.1 LacI family transcriptional regulator [Defluviitaleaceae bacterium]
MTTIHDVAKHAGVSIATVSNVINNNAKVSAGTAERVRQAINDLNYIPNIAAKGLKTNVTRIIGVLMEDIRNFASPYIIDGICQQCENDGYHVNVDNLQVNRRADYNVDDTYGQLAKSGDFQTSVREALKTLLSARICGLIYLGTHPRDVSGLLPPLNIPVVYAYCYAEKPASSKALNISYDDYQGAQLAVKNIIRAGHTKIAIIGGLINSYATHRRMMGYQTALMEYALPLYPEYILSGNWSYESGHELAGKLFNLPNPPTAVFVMNDLMAFGVIDSLKGMGIRVPDDVSVHGFDDLLASRYFSPPLSTISLPLHEIGEKAAGSVIKMAENGNEASGDKFILIPCRHVPRASV